MKKSNITINSNIYPVKGMLNTDREFLKHVEGKTALEIINMHSDFRKGRDFTEAQNHQWDYGTKCYYNEDGDYTWGLILRDGKLQTSCRCLNVSCKNFKKCRPDFNENELKYIIHKPLTKVDNENNKESSEIILPDPKRYNDELSREDREIGNEEEIKDNSSTDKPLAEGTLGTNIIDGIINIWDKLNTDKEKGRLLKDKDGRQGQRNENENIILLQEINGKKKEHKQNIVDQKYVIEASENVKLLVNAGPGTGKTYTLIERIKYLTDCCELDPFEHMIVLCFSRAAVAEIKKRLEEAINNGDASPDSRRLQIRTFDSFATFLLTELDENRELQGKSYDERIQMAIEEIENNNDIFGGMKHFIVDEIQDLVGVRAELVQTILKNSHCGFTLLGDSCQSIYDYQIEDKENDVDSEKFYRWLKDYYKDELLRVEFDKNFRQTSKLRELTSGLRQSILEGSETDRLESLINTMSSVEQLKSAYYLPDYLLKSESLCLLCRNNGEALKLSGYLRKQGIKHALQKPLTSKNLSSWLGYIIGEVQDDVLDYEEFKILSENHTQNISEEMIRRRWNSLKEIERGRSSKLRIRDLKDSILREKVKDDSLYTEDLDRIVVSTIHRAKGREFDDVVVINNSFNRILEQNDEDYNINEEVKTYYVAFTRPKKSVYRAVFKKAYLKKTRKNDGRWIETGFNRFRKKPKISHIEVGKDNDVNRLSFIDMDLFKNEQAVFQNQKYIREEVNCGDEVVLRKNIKSVNKIVYDIYHIKDDSERLIGRMSDSFLRDLGYAYGYIGRNVDSQYYPEWIEEVYIDNQVTYILNETPTNVPRVYLSTQMWNGVTLVGFGKTCWYNYD